MIDEANKTVIAVELGELCVKVEDPDSDTASELWDEKFEKMINEAEEDYSALLSSAIGYE